MENQDSSDNNNSQEEILDGIQLSQLSKNYAFDPISLKRNFSVKVNELITDSRIKLKLYQLFGFRLRYTGLIKINDPLFYMNKITFGTLFKTYFEGLQKYNPNNNNGITISQFLKDDFFSDIPYIRDYFCYSTFPSIFGNFITEDSFSDGYDFIKNNFQDKNVLPFLVSSFLNHSMLFQDRLISTFISSVLKFISDRNSKTEEEKINKNNEKDDSDSNNVHQNWPFENITLEDSLIIFVQSFKSCLSYLSQYQIKIVQDLWNSDEKLAIFIISELFLKDILQSLSKYHKLSDHTNVLTVDYSVINPPNTAYISHHNILSEIYNHLDFKQIIQLICDSPVYFQLARIDELIFNGGCSCVLSMSDSKIIQLFYHYVKFTGDQERTIKNSIPARTKSYAAGNGPIKKFELDSFTNDCFDINTSLEVYYTSNEAPDPKDRTQDEQKMCLETYLVHKFLLSHSGHLHKLQISTDATKAIVNSKIREYIGEVLFIQNVFEPYEYEKNQIIKYLTLAYQMRVASYNTISFDYNKVSATISTIFNNLNDQFNNLRPKELSIKFFEAIANDINSELISAKSASRIHIFKDDFQVNNFVIFLEYLIQVSYRLRIAVFNKEKTSKIIQEKDFDFEPTEEEAAEKDFKNIEEKIVKLVLNKSKKISSEAFSYHYELDDTLEEFDEDGYDEIQSIIYWSNIAMRKDSMCMRSEFNIGQKIQTFVSINKLIKEATKKSDFILNNPDNKQFVFYKILKYTKGHLKKEKVYLGDIEKEDEITDSDEKFKLRSCIYLRANVIKAVFYLKQILNKEKSNLLMQIELNEAYRSLNQLAVYLGLNLTF